MIIISTSYLYVYDPPSELCPKFWLKVYTHYSSDQGVIHDKYQMNRIYGTIPLVDPYIGSGRKINNKRIKAAKKKYKAILSKLMQGKPPTGPEEQRVAQLFGPKANAAVFRSAMRSLRCQTGQKDRFREGLVRSGAYLDKIKQIFRDAGLPEDLAYLPHVESSFNPRAYSKFGAAGMWQFTRATGKQFMKVGYTVDERRDPILSSFAAAKLLRNNYRKLNSWPMAITAYNHGVTGMRRAQRKKGSYERIFKEYRTRSFRFASRNFYSEFLAAREAAKNFRQFFGDVELNSPRKIHSVKLKGYVSLRDIARHLNLDLAELRGLNPALRGPVFNGQKYVPRGYHLQLPDRSGTDWNQLMARLPQNLYRENQKRSSIYRVRRGDTAGKIARRHGVKLKDLIAINNLDQRATIYINQNLRIPLPEPKSSRIAKQTKKKPAASFRPASDQVPANQTALSAAVDLSMQPSAADLKSPVATGHLQSTTSGKDSGSVTQTDPAGTPSQVDQLALSQQQALALNPAFLKLSLRPAIMQGHFAVDRVSIKDGKPIGHIRVEAEETLGHFAEWLNVTAGEIRRLNGLHYGRSLHLSQRIKIPLHRSTQNEFEVKRFEYHQELAEDFFASYRVEKVWTYSIKKGDNIWTLSRREFDVPVWLIKQFNGHVDFGALVPSQKLIVPVVEKNA